MTTNVRRRFVEEKKEDVSPLSPEPADSADTLAGSGSKGKSLKDRGKTPASFYIVVGYTFFLNYLTGYFSLDTVEKWKHSMSTSAMTAYKLLKNSLELLSTIFTDKESHTTQEYAQTAIALAVIFSLLYVFFVAPFRAGMWTGERATRHSFHRFAGLSYLFMYTAAWIEYATDYEYFDQHSVLPRTIAINGIMQGLSAYYSFRVLPELNDPGYYSDKAVLSRTFVHENQYFSLLSVFGTVYYHTKNREMLRQSYLGKFIEAMFIFWPYITIRLFFPVTQFSRAGTTHKGRSTANEKFYEFGTFTVKIFYLWAKYFLGFFVQFTFFLEVVTPQDKRLLNGMLLLNIGTISLAVFLHTLRFKKVLPPKLAFSIYLAQIWLTFYAIPLAYKMFVSHPNLCYVTMAGLLVNMTRSRKLHGVWCLACMVLMTQFDIEW